MKAVKTEITEALLKRLSTEPMKGPFGVAGERVLSDTLCPGFKARLFPKPDPPHTVSLIVQRKMTMRKQPGGPLTSTNFKRVIGPWPGTSVKEAREQARIMIGMMAAGDDPYLIQEEKRARTAAAREAKTLTFGVVFSRYQTESSGVTEATDIDRAKVVKWMAKSPLWKLQMSGQVSVEDIEATFVPLFDAAMRHQKKPAWYGGKSLSLATAHKIYRYCQAAWNHYQERTHGITPSRNAGIFGAMKKARRWDQPKPRTRHLDTTTDQAAAWVKGLLAMREHEDPAKQVFADYLWCLLVWGGRRDETRLITPDCIDLNHGHAWFVEANTKGKRDHYFPLTPFTADLIKQRLERNLGWGKRVEYVFPSRQHGKPIYNARSAFLALAEETGIALSPHDLRRTVATDTAKVTDFNKAVVSKTLSHREAGATQLYIQQQVALLRPSFLARENMLLGLAGLKEAGPATPNTDALMKRLLSGEMTADEKEKLSGLILGIMK